MSCEVCWAQITLDDVDVCSCFVPYSVLLIDNYV